MKNIYFTFIILTVIGCGTDLGEGEFYKYTIRNESGKNIIIRSYLPGFPNVNPINTVLNDGEELLKTYQDGLPPSSYNYGDYFGDRKNKRDSIKVIYNSSKVSFFLGEHSQNERNPLNGAIYNKTEETFTFTEQDYLNAEDCNNNCD